MPGTDDNHTDVTESELDRLMNEAVPSALAPPATARAEGPTEYECSKCGVHCSVQCPICLGPHCELHSSPLDPEYCNLCLDEPMLSIRELPLTNSDGHEVPGRRLQPGPRFETLSGRISNMTQYQLDATVTKYRELVRVAEKTLDFRRTVLTHAEVEQSQRALAERRALRANKTKFAPGVVTIDRSGKQVLRTAKPSPLGSTPSGTPDILKAMQQLDALIQKRTQTQTKDKSNS